MSPQYDTSLSRSRGRGFENQVVKTLKAWGYTRTERKLLSGSNLKTPYDVKVSPFRLKIECKRTAKSHIGIQGKWLDKISDNLILVFAVGLKISKKNPIYCISSHRGDKGQFFDMEVKKNKKINVCDHLFEIERSGRESAWVKDSFYLVHDGKLFWVQDFKSYMEQNWKIEQTEKEVSNVEPDRKSI
jgi:hypothetical protein